MKISAAVLLLALSILPSAAQDIRGLEVCTAEKQMERRTGCLQANTEFLQQALGIDFVGMRRAHQVHGDVGINQNQEGVPVR